MEKKLKEQIVDLLKQILETVKQPKNEKMEKVTFTIQEAAFYMGTSREKITELVYKVNTDFPFFKVGSKTLIDKRLLDKWIEKVTEEHRQL